MDTEINNDQIKVSVIVPAHNVAPWIERAVESLKSQTLHPYLEVIIVENGSTDNTLDLAWSLARKNNGWLKVLSLPEGDLSTARNYGISHAKGKYIGFIDADDYVELDMLETLYNAAEKTDAEITSCNFVLHPIEGEPSIEGDGDSGEVLKVDPIESAVAIIMDEETASCCCRLFRKEVFRSFYFPEGEFYEDGAVIYRWTVECTNITHVRRALYHYVLRPGSITTSTDGDGKKTKDRFNVFYDRYVFIMGWNAISDKRRKKIVRYIVRRMYTFFKPFLRACSINEMYDDEVMSIRQKMLAPLDSWLGYVHIKHLVRILRIRYMWKNYASKYMKR